MYQNYSLRIKVLVHKLEKNGKISSTSNEKPRKNSRIDNLDTHEDVQAWALFSKIMNKLIVAITSLA